MFFGFGGGGGGGWDGVSGVSRVSSIVVGFGKGGWVVVVVSIGSRFGVIMFVMYLFFNGIIGWEGFLFIVVGVSNFLLRR